MPEKKKEEKATAGPSSSEPGILELSNGSIHPAEAVPLNNQGDSIMEASTMPDSVAMSGAGCLIIGSYK